MNSKTEKKIDKKDEIGIVCELFHGIRIFIIGVLYSIFLVPAMLFVFVIMFVVIFAFFHPPGSNEKPQHVHAHDEKHAPEDERKKKNEPDRVPPKSRPRSH